MEAVGSDGHVTKLIVPLLMGGRCHTENRSGAIIPPHFLRESKQHVLLGGFSQYLDVVLNLMENEEKEI